MTSFKQGSFILPSCDQNLSPNSSIFSMDSLETTNTTTQIQESQIIRSSPQLAKQSSLHSWMHQNITQSQPFIGSHQAIFSTNTANQIQLNDAQFQSDQQAHIISSSTSLQLSPNPPVFYQPININNSHSHHMLQYQSSQEGQVQLQQQHELLQQQFWQHQQQPHEQQLLSQQFTIQQHQQQYNQQQWQHHSQYYSPQKQQQQQHSNSPNNHRHYNPPNPSSSFPQQNSIIRRSSDSSATSSEDQLKRLSLIGYISNDMRSKAISDDPKYKTELCNTYQLTGKCEYGNKCKFAHGNHQLLKKQLQQQQQQPSQSSLNSQQLLKTKPCRQFHEKMYCPYGSRCNFQHEVRTLAQIQVQHIYQKRLLSDDLNIQVQNSEQQPPYKSTRLPIFNYISSGNNLFPSKNQNQSRNQ